MKIMVVSGPNLNFLGIREPDIYGTVTYDDCVRLIQTHCASRGVAVTCKQSNHEGDLIDFIQSCHTEGYDGIVINAGAYTHTSIALLDALQSVALPAVEVHISDTEKREPFRRQSYLRAACFQTIKGHGISGYCEAIDALIAYAKERTS